MMLFKYRLTVVEEVVTPKWYNVNADTQIWSGHSDNHQKMGKLIAPAAIKAIDEYKGSFQFEEYGVDVNSGGEDRLKPLSTSYPQYWIRIEDTSLEPYDPNPDPEPDPEPDLSSDAELGAAFRIVAKAWRDG